MFLEYSGLMEQPFGVTPDPRGESRTSALQIHLPAEISSVAPMPAPVSLAAPNLSSTGPGADAHSDHKSQALSLNAGTQSPAPAENPTERSRSITLIPGQTLYRISVENFGKYNDEVLRELHELNPWLVDPDFVQSGQKIRLRSVKEVSGDEHAAVNQGPNTAAAGVKKP